MKRHVEKGQNKRTRITIGAREIEGKVLKRGKMFMRNSDDVLMMYFFMF